MNTLSAICDTGIRLSVAFDSGNYAPPSLLDVPGRGKLLRHPDGPGALMPLPQDRDPEAVRSALDHLSRASDIAVEQIATETTNRHPSKMPEAAFDIYKRVLSTPFRALLAALADWQHEAASAWNDFSSPHTAKHEVATAVGIEWFKMNPSQVMTKAKVASADQLAALLRLKGMIELPPEGWTVILEDYVVRAILEGARSNVIFARQPSLAEPLTSGINEAATRNWVRAFIAAHEKIADRQREIAAMLQGLCAVIAAGTERRPDEIWTVLNGK